MKTILSVFVSFIILLVAWYIFIMLLSALGFLGALASNGMVFMNLIIGLINFVVAPLYGAFVAIVITPKIIKSVTPSKLVTYFITVTIISYVFILVLLITITDLELSDISLITEAIVQVAAIIGGAKLGEFFRSEEALSRDNISKS